MIREVCPGANGDGKLVEEADPGYENEKDGGGENEFFGGVSGDKKYGKKIVGTLIYLFRRRLKIK
jgi:hypothetical protein